MPFKLSISYHSNFFVQLTFLSISNEDVYNSNSSFPIVAIEYIYIYIYKVFHVVNIPYLCILYMINLYTKPKQISSSSNLIHLTNTINI